MRLTGRAVAGWDTAVLRWCTDNRDASNVRWDPALARRCGLDVARLPELVRPASVVGTVLPEVAAAFGLPDGVRVVAGTGDTTAAAVGAGATGEYDAHLYVGTSAWLSCHVPFKRTDIVHNIASLPSVVPGTYWVATVQDVAGKAVDWLLDSVVYAQDGMLDASPRPTDALERLNALAVSAPPGLQRGRLHPVAERRAHPRRRRDRAWRLVQRVAVDDPCGPRPQRLRGHRAQRALDAGCRGALHPARRARWVLLAAVHRRRGQLAAVVPDDGGRPPAPDPSGRGPRRGERPRSCAHRGHRHRRPGLGGRAVTGCGRGDLHARPRGRRRARPAVRRRSGTSTGAPTASTPFTTGEGPTADGVAGLGATRWRARRGRAGATTKADARRLHSVRLVAMP